MNSLRLFLIELLVVLMLTSCASIFPKKDTIKPTEIEKAKITLDDVARYANECISLLEQSVPDGFKLLADDIYQAIDNNDYRILICQNGEVIAASFNAAFSKRDNASRLNDLFHTFFISNDWESLEESNEDDVMYNNNDTYAVIDIKQEPREDGYTVTYVCFTKNESFFSENFIKKQLQED